MSAFIAAFYGLVGALDAACAGFRQAAGRNALIRKKTWLWRRTVVGLLTGVFADVLVIVVLSTLNHQQHRDLVHAGSAALTIAIPAVVVFTVATMLRAIPSIEFKSHASGILFGPLTFFRPYAIVACALVAFVSRPKPVVAVMCALFLLLITWWTRWPWPLVSWRRLVQHARWRDVSRAQ